MRIRELFVLFAVVSGLALYTGHLAYQFGKWVCYYNESMKHLGDMQ